MRLLIGLAGLVWLMAFAPAAPVAADTAVDGAAAHAEPEPSKQAAPRDPAEPTRELLCQRLRELAEAVAARDAEAVWQLVDQHTQEGIARMLEGVQREVERLEEAQRERVPPGWSDEDTLGSVLTLDARGYLGLMLRSEAGGVAARQLAQIEGVERLLWPDRHHNWVVRLINRAWREAHRQRPGRDAEVDPDEGREIRFIVQGIDAELAPTVATYEQGRWRLRLLPD